MNENNPGSQTYHQTWRRRSTPRTPGLSSRINRFGGCKAVGKIGVSATRSLAEGRQFSECRTSEVKWLERRVYLKRAREPRPAQATKDHNRPEIFWFRSWVSGEVRLWVLGAHLQANDRMKTLSNSKLEMGPPAVHRLN